MWLNEPLRAPEFPHRNPWLNSEPLSFDQQRRLWLIEFWDYTDLASIRTLPYLVEWHRRYAHRGLAIVGVHSPRFRFAHQRHLVEQALEEFGVEYPVMLDNYHALWRAYDNDCWPALYLIDAARQIRYVHLGEGRYDEAETAVHLLLRQMDPSVDLPPIMRPLRSDDKAGSLLSAATPDLYAGYERGRFGDPDGYVYDHTVMYEDCGERDEGVLYAHGQWHTTSDYLAFMGERGYLAFTYRAVGVSAILSPTWDEIALMLQLQQRPAPRVGIWLDSGPVPPTEAGDDIAYDRRQGSFVVVDRPRPFNLTRHPHVRRHELRLTFNNRDVTAYAFAFLSCVETRQ
jgi:hypothetical protein